jgi:hypothetical protein
MGSTRILSGEWMKRSSVLLLLCCSLLLPMPAVARLPGPQQAAPASKVRDLAEIRSSRVLRVLVNQSRNSSGEVQGQAIGVEYHRLRAFEQYLNGYARDGQEVTLKIIPKAKDQLLGALQRGEGDLVAPGELLDMQAGHAVSSSEPIASGMPLVLVGRKGERSYTRSSNFRVKPWPCPPAAPPGTPSARSIRNWPAQTAAIKIEWVDPTWRSRMCWRWCRAGFFT